MVLAGKGGFVSGKSFTGASAVFSSMHHGENGEIHGHAWRIRAWWDFDHSCVLDRSAQLKDLLAKWDHGLLPDPLSLSEDLARHIGELLDCCEVEIERDDLKGLLLARWRRC